MIYPVFCQNTGYSFYLQIPIYRTVVQVENLFFRFFSI